jgi:hypothetical protein
MLAGDVGYCWVLGWLGASCLGRQDKSGYARWGFGILLGARAWGEGWVGGLHAWPVIKSGSNPILNTFSILKICPSFLRSVGTRERGGGRAGNVQRDPTVLLDYTILFN